MIHLLSIPFAAAPFAFALLRALRTGSDFRPLWMAFASLLGAIGVMALGKARRRTAQPRLALCVLTFVITALLAGAAAFLLGATSIPGAGAVALGFGFCWAGHHALLLLHEAAELS